MLMLSALPTLVLLKRTRSTKQNAHKALAWGNSALLSKPYLMVTLQDLSGLSGDFDLAE